MKKILLLPLLMIPMFFFHNPVTTAEATYDPYQVVNGGFESGNLAGWTRYGLWKNESGNQAFDPSLVTNGTYFDQTDGTNNGYKYDRDGNYCLGITSSTVKWSQSEERMGYLRSSNFMLGGTGWISFKLGGGQVADFAYVSVRNASNDVEVARFGNRWFNNTIRATIVRGSTVANAQAYLFPYYYDLGGYDSNLMGQSLYFLLCDTAGYNWSVLSADSFITYYPTAPSPDADSTAINILPTIQHTGETTQANLTTLSGSLTGWTNVDNIWKTDSGFCRSDNGGNGALGVLRSSAFIVTPTYDHIRMGWASNFLDTAHMDKKIFISIKEVGSNTEVLRILRRANLNTFIGSGRQNAMIDLTFLNGNPTTKEYYMEISDNSNDDYGLNFVDSVHFILDSGADGTDTWTGVTNVYPGDQVTYIWSGTADTYHATGLSTSFPETSMTSTQEAQVMAGDFLSLTASYCAASNGGGMDASGVWTALSNQYYVMSADAKDYFFNTTTDSVISGAKARYLVLINTYSSLAANPFVVNSSNTPYTGPVNNISSYLSGDMGTMLIVLLSGTALAAFSILFFKKKRQAQ